MLITAEDLVVGGSVKAEGLGDGEWANHRQAALDAATRTLVVNCDELTT